MMPNRIHLIILTLLTLSACSTAPLQLETIAELQQAPGNVAVSKSGRIFISQHSIFRPKVKMIEVLSDGSTKPYPNEQWATTKRKDGQSLTGVLGIEIDEQDRLWMLDIGRPARIIVWDTVNDKLDRILNLDGPAKNRASFFNKMAIDLVNNKVYVSDSSRINPAIVVIDIETGEAYRILERHPSVTAKAVSLIPDDSLTNNPARKATARTGVNGITIDTESQWLYYTPAQGDTLWRISTKDLLNRSLSANEMGERVQRFGDRPPCDGITIDKQGNIYITDVPNNAIGVVDQTGNYRQLLQDPQRLSWPDSIVLGPDNYIYVVSNQMHRSAVFNRGKDLTQKPFYLTRFKALGH
jgi:sugar lactone lactonase YvrE